MVTIDTVRPLTDRQSAALKMLVKRRRYTWRPQSEALAIFWRKRRHPQAQDQWRGGPAHVSAARYFCTRAFGFVMAL